MQQALAWTGEIADGLAENGLAVIAEALPGDIVSALRERAVARHARGELRIAGTGRAGGRSVDPSLRGDRIAWIDPEDVDEAEQAYLDLVAELRGTLNRELMAGIEEVEAHYAVYPPGARYARHRDGFRDDDSRVFSTVLYLNERWSVADGGALRLYVAPGQHRDVEPRAGTLVAFCSERFEHEVLPARRERYSLAGWLRRRAVARWRR